MSFKSKYLTVATNYSIPSAHRELLPDDNAVQKKVPYLDPWYETCLSCSLDKCYRDGARDDDSRERLKEGRKLCPIVIAKSK